MCEYIVIMPESNLCVVALAFVFEKEYNPDNMARGVMPTHSQVFNNTTQMERELGYANNSSRVVSGIEEAEGRLGSNP